MTFLTRKGTDATLEDGTMLVVMWCPPDRDVMFATRTVDLKADAAQFQSDDVYDGDAWAHSLQSRGILQWVCGGKETPCAEHKAGTQFEHVISHVLCVYPHGVRLGGTDLQY